MKRKVLIILGWICLWQILAAVIHNDILMVGPLQVLSALFHMAAEPSFWISVAATMSRIIAGFLLGTLAGVLLAWLAYEHDLIRDILQPAMLFLKAVPVVSFIVLILIWAGGVWLGFAISMIVVLPIVYVNVLEGLMNTNRNLLEMAQVFRLAKMTCIRKIYSRSVKPYFISALSLACGMAVKSGIAAEVIGQTRNTIGNGIYMSKVYLAIDQLFAWTFVILLLSWLFEKAVSILLAKAGKHL